MTSGGRLARDREVRGTVAILPPMYGAESPEWLCVVGRTCSDTRSWASRYSTGITRDPPGVSRMKALARSYVYWPGIDKDIERLVSDCATCQEHRNVPPSAELHP